MSTKIVPIIASVITFILVLVVVVVFGFGGIVMLNGFMNAGEAVNTGFACLGITLIVCPILAWILVRTLASKFKMNNVLAAVISVVMSTFLGGVMGFSSMIIMGIVAEIMLGS